MKPSYIKLYETGELESRSDKLNDILESCTLCPHNCLVNRQKGEYGKCRAGDTAVVSSAGPHFGEEPPLVGINGSGTIFFAHCNLVCIFCQNYSISHLDEGVETGVEDISAHMLNLQRFGCHNINLVTPTHFVPQIVEAVLIAVGRGFEIPIVYNCGGYENVETLKMLEGIIDIYMPDAKFFDDEMASELTNAGDYSVHMKKALAEMYRQVGDLKISRQEIAEKGILVRHLVMPGMTEDSKRILKFIAEEISSDTYVNVMGQYRPCFRANEINSINRCPDESEIQDISEYAAKLKLVRGL